MAKFMVVFVLICAVLVDAAPEYRVKSSTQSTWEKIMCSDRHDKQRLEYMQKAKCGPPREVFITLKRQAIHEEVTPSAVWIKRCKGTCYNGFECHPTKVQKVSIPIRIYDVKSDREACSTYEIEEHLECGCCDRRSCEGGHVFNPRKCSCQCPNSQERRSCLRKRNMRWSRSKCACEHKRRVQ